MRLAIIGPQNTGKTTFVQDFVRTFPHYTTPEETYRDFVEKKQYRINQETSAESQVGIRDFLFDQIKGTEGENVIFDRSLLDNYIYSFAQHEAGKIEKEIIDETKAMMYTSLSYLDRLVFIPTAVGVELVSDHVRDTDKLYIDYINKLFLKEIIDLAEHNIIPIWVISGSRESRLAEIGKKLEKIPVAA